MPVLFKTGRVVATPGALELLARTQTDPKRILYRHILGDWGDMCKEDIEANDAAMRHGGRLFSSYNITPSDKVWIITEADRSATTILLPEDY